MKRIAILYSSLIFVFSFSSVSQAQLIAEQNTYTGDQLPDALAQRVVLLSFFPQPGDDETTKKARQNIRHRAGVRDDDTFVRYLQNWYDAETMMQSCLFSSRQCAKAFLQIL